MPLIAGPFQVVAGLLLVAGVAKLARPTPTSEVARAAGIPASTGMIRVFALAEVAAAVAVLAVGGRVSALAIAILYGVFAGFVLVLRVRDVQTAGCGCFGREAEEPPGVLHIAVDVIAATIAVAAIVSPVPDVLGVMAAQPLGGIPYVGFLVLGVWLATILLTELPRLAHIAGEAPS